MNTRIQKVWPKSLLGMRSVGKFITVIMLGLTLSAVVFWMIEPKYRAETLIEIEPIPESMVEFSPVPLRSTEAETARIETQLHLLRSTALIDWVYGRVPEGYRHALSDTPEDEPEALARARFAERYAQIVHAERLTESYMLQLTALHADPMLAASLVEHSARAFIDMKAEARVDRAQEDIAILEAAIARGQRELARLRESAETREAAPFSPAAEARLSQNIDIMEHRLSEAVLQANLPRAAERIVAPARAGSRPVWPNPASYWSIAVAASVFLAIMVVFWMNRHDTRIHSVEQLSAPPIGIMPKKVQSVTQFGRLATQQSLAPHAVDAMSPVAQRIAAEAAMSRKTGAFLVELRYAFGSDIFQPPLQIAEALARAGHTVLLVDLDMAQGELTRHICPRPQLSLDDAISRVDDPALLLKRPNHFGAHQAEILGNATPSRLSLNEFETQHAFDRLLRLYSDIYDVILVHAPVLTDWISIAPRVPDMRLVFVREHVSRIEDVIAALGASLQSPQDVQLVFISRKAKKPLERAPAPRVMRASQSGAVFGAKPPPHLERPNL